MGSSADDDGSTTKSTHHVDEEDDDDDTIRSPLTIASMNRTHDQMLLYVKPSLTLQLVNVHSMPKFPSRQNIPQQMGKYMDWKVEEDNDGDDGDADGGVELFYPILHNSEFWITMDSMIEVNDILTTTPTITTTSNSENDIQTTHHQPTNTNTKNITLELHLQDINMWKWQFMSQMEESWRLQEDLEGDTSSSSSSTGGGGMDVLRTMLLETNPILLIITAIVSVFHTLFDILAFKNDIKFYKGKRSMEGLSVRSMVVNTASMFVILLDNETSFIVLMSNGVGVPIECWKITKAVDVSMRRRVKGNTTENGDGDGVFWGAFGWEFRWEEKEGYNWSKTKEYDEIATTHLDTGCTHSCIKNTRVGTHGFSTLSLGLSTCSDSL